jgi:L-cysteine desulfidase
VRVEDLMDVKVKVPNISEQKYYIQVLNISSLFGLVNEPESVYQVLKHIKHSYSQINDAIGSDIRNLINYIHQKAKTKETISLSDKVSARKDATTLEMLFERIIDAQITAGDLFSTIKNIMEFGQSEMHKEIVDINEFLKSEKKYLESLGENLNIIEN